MSDPDSVKEPGRWARLFKLIRGKQSSDLGAQEIWKSTLLIGSIVLAFGFGGLLALWFWAAGLTSKSVTPGYNLRSILGCDVLVASAAASVGGLLGFIFGMPRTLDPASRVAVATAASQGGPMASSQAALAANTNLERISDWLTTLLIGATLVQIKDVVHWIGGIGSELAGGAFKNDQLIPVLIVYYSALAFIGVYLVTRLYLTYALQQTLFLLTGNYTDYPLQTLKADLADALATGDPADLARVNAEFSAWRFQGSDIDDPGLNYSLTRVLALTLAKNAAGDKQEETISKLKDVVARASRSPKIKNQIADDLTSGRLATGNADVDADLKSQTSSP